MGQTVINRRRLSFAVMTDNSVPTCTEIIRYTAYDDTRDRRTDYFPADSMQKSGQMCLIE